MIELKDVTEDLEKIEFNVGSPFNIKADYRWMIVYNYPGPLSCLSGVQSGCSKPVEAGLPLGYGRFCDYCVLCAGTTVTIMYNEFRPVA